jgi:hypothetical protein
MKNKRLFILAILIFFFSVSCKNNNAAQNVDQGQNLKTEKVKFLPQEIVRYANLELDILNHTKNLSKTIENFKRGDHYFVFGQSSNVGGIPEKKRAAEIDAKRWGAIFMKYLLTGEENLDMKGQYVNFLEFEGEFNDNRTGKVYRIYKFKEREK